MGQMADAVEALTNYVSKKTGEVSRAAAAAETKSKGTPDGQAINTFTNASIANTRASTATNPIAQMGQDTLNQITTTITQQLVGNALRKINLTPIQNAVQGVFQILATASAFESELAMEFARNTARNINKEIANKRKIITAINSEVTALHNACMYILNSTPFFDAYLQQLLQAFTLLNTADRQLIDVISVLQNQQKYKSNQFNSAINNLVKAQTLILPDRGVDVSSIRGVTDFISATAARPTNKQAVAAALSIPGITLKLGNLMIEYAKATTNLNLLLNTFADALAGYVDSFNANPNIYQAAIDHVSAGESQLKSLINDMDELLNPTNTIAYDVTSASYTNKVTSSATLWGVKLTAIIEFLKFNPGAGAANLDKTAASVLAYDKAVETISLLGDIKYQGGTLPVNEGREDAVYVTGVIAKLMLTVNTIVATRQTKTQVTTQFQSVRAAFSASSGLLGQIQNAITPFLNTQTTFSGAAQAIVGQALGIANQYGLDRVAGLLSDGGVRKLFGITPDTATYSGSAVTGMNLIVSSLQKSPSATDSQVQRLTDLRDKVNSEKVNDDIEANRSYGDTIDSLQANIKAKIDEIKSTISPAREAARQIDTTDATTPEDKARATMGSVIPGFNSNSNQAGVSNIA